MCVVLYIEWTLWNFMAINNISKYFIAIVKIFVQERLWIQFTHFRNLQRGHTGSCISWNHCKTQIVLTTHNKTKTSVSTERPVEYTQSITHPLIYSILWHFKSWRRDALMMLSASLAHYEYNIPVINGFHPTGPSYSGTAWKAGFPEHMICHLLAFRRLREWRDKYVATWKQENCWELPLADNLDNSLKYLWNDPL